MNFFQRWNPVYLLEKLKRLESDLEVEREMARRRQRYLLEKVDSLERVVKAEADRNDVLNNLNNDLESKLSKVRLRADTKEDELKSLTSDFDGLKLLLQNKNEEIASLNFNKEKLEETSSFLVEEINILKTELAKRDRINEKLWVAIFGYGRDEMTLLNKSFWGKDLVAVALPGEEHDNNHA